MSDDKKRDDYTIEMGERARDDERPPPPPKSPFQPPKSGILNHPMLPVFSYCASSISMTVANKFVLQPGFNLNFFFLCLQSCVCVLAVHTCKTLGFITYRDFSTTEARKWFPVSLLLVGMIYTGSKALQYLSIPVYTIFKNLTIIITAYGEVLLFGSSVSRLTLFSFGLIVLSSVVAAWADISHALASNEGATEAARAQISTLNAGYLWMLFNCFCTTTYVLGMRTRIKITGFKDFDTMFYNNFLTIPVLIIASLVLEDWSSANINVQFPAEGRNRILFAIFVTGIFTVFISYTSAWCVRVTSGATYSMVGALNKIPIAVSGLIFFGDPVTPRSVSAISIGAASGIVYAIAKNQQSAAKADGLPVAKPVVSASNQSARDSMRS